MMRKMASTLNYFFLRFRAMALLAFGRNRAALADFDRVLESRPGDVHALASRAHLCAQLGFFDAATESLQRLVDIKPKNAVVWFNLAYVLQQAGHHTNAQYAFRCALSLDERMDRAWYGLGLSLMHEHKLNDAIAALKKTTALQPMSPHGWFRLAEAWLALGKPEQAHKVVRHLQQFEPKVAAQLAHRFLAVLPGAVTESAGRELDTPGLDKVERVRGDLPEVEPVLTHAAH